MSKKYHNLLRKDWRRCLELAPWARVPQSSRRSCCSAVLETYLHFHYSSVAMIQCETLYHTHYASLLCVIRHYHALYAITHCTSLSRNRHHYHALYNTITHCTTLSRTVRHYHVLYHHNIQSFLMRWTIICEISINILLYHGDLYLPLFNIHPFIQYKRRQHL